MYLLIETSEHFCKSIWIRVNAKCHKYNCRSAASESAWQQQARRGERHRGRQFLPILQNAQLLTCMHGVAVLRHDWLISSQRMYTPLSGVSEHNFIIFFPPRIKRSSVSRNFFDLVHPENDDGRVVLLSLQ